MSIGFCGGNITKSESFIAFYEKRSIYELGNVMELNTFYTQHGLSPWIY